MASRRGRLLVIGFLVVAVVSVLRMASVERQKSRLAEAYHKAQELVVQLEAERDALSLQLGHAQETAQVQTTELQDAQQRLQALTEQLATSKTQLASLRQEHQALRQEHASLGSRLGAVMSEKQRLEIRFSSLKELKLAIREVKQKLSEQRWAAWRARGEQRRAADQQQLAAGNRGYLVREGLPTLGTGVRLHVHVLEPQSQ